MRDDVLCLQISVADDRNFLVYTGEYRAKLENAARQ